MNAALRKALAEAQLTETDVAAHLGVDPKTVRRWLAGQRPYPRHRWALAEFLQAEEDILWPPRSKESKAHTLASNYIQRFYAHRWQVPREVWWNLFSEAEQEIGILVYSGLFMADDAGILDLLAARARDGVSIRILLGDPESHPVKQRGEEELIGEAMAAKASNSLVLFRAFLNIENIKIRLHSSILYNSIYLTEKRMIINHHIYGIPAARCPTVDIRREAPSGFGQIYLNSFNVAWEAGKDVADKMPN